MPASCSSSELSAHLMAPAGAIAHSRAHLCPQASTLPLSSLVSPLRPLGLGLLGRGDPRSSMYFYIVTDAGPASHRVRLWQGGPASTFCRFRLLVLQFTGTSIPGVRLLLHPDVRKRPWPLRRPRGDGNGGRFVHSPCLPSWRGLRFNAVHQMLSLWHLFPILVPVQRWSSELLATTVGECRRRHSL